MSNEEIRRELRAPYCLGCSPENPIGLHLSFRRTGPEEVATEVVLPREFSGWEGLAHGGVVSLLIDEVTSWCVAVCLDEPRFATTELTVRYVRPTPVGRPLTASGRIVATEGRTVTLSAEVRRADGMITAQGKVRMVRLDEERYRRLLGAGRD